MDIKFDEELDIKLKSDIKEVIEENEYLIVDGNLKEVFVGKDTCCELYVEIKNNLITLYTYFEDGGGSWEPIGMLH